MPFYNQLYESISIHTPARGVTVTPCNPLDREMDFNPHSRKGSDLHSNLSNGIIKISIHTPARGVTISAKTGTKKQLISIHTPARGVTSPLEKLPTTLEISIHTPARGVT